MGHDWHKTMHSPVTLATPGPELERFEVPNWPDAWRCDDAPSVTHDMDPGGNGPFQKGGEREAHRYLKTFFEGRVKGYRRQIGRPLESRKSCSHLSPYLAWGMPQHAAGNKRIERRKCRGPKWTSRRLAADCGWQRHFIQKFESGGRIAVRKREPRLCGFPYNGTPESLLEAWKRGQTGIPLIDACMRCVTETAFEFSHARHAGQLFDAPLDHP